MNTKEARIALRAALSQFRGRIKFPRFRLKDILESEDIRAIIKDFVSRKIQSSLEGK